MVGCFVVIISSLLYGRDFFFYLGEKYFGVVDKDRDLNDKVVNDSDDRSIVDLIYVLLFVSKNN